MSRQSNSLLLLTRIVQDKVCLWKLYGMPQVQKLVEQMARPESERNTSKTDAMRGTFEERRHLIVRQRASVAVVNARSRQLFSRGTTKVHGAGRRCGGWGSGVHVFSYAYLGSSAVHL